MSRFAADLFAQSPALLYPLIALVLFFVVFLVVVIRAVRMKESEADQYARIPLEEDLEVPHE
ncbi:MAG: hypothetical protein PVI24_17155 [Myxococcales bacterium]|jgi:hypothetical protein